MMYKPVLKSVRFSSDVYEMINGFEGKTFSDKLENLVRRYFNEVSDRREKLAYLDRAVRRRNEQCNSYWKFQDQLQDIKDLVDLQEETLKKLYEVYEHFGKIVYQDIVQTSGYLSVVDDKSNQA